MLGFGGQCAHGSRPKRPLSGPGRHHKATSLGAVLALSLGMFASLGGSASASVSAAAASSASQARPHHFDPTRRAA